MHHPNVPFDVHNSIVFRVMELVDLANAYYGLALPYPFVHYDIKHKPAAGECTPVLARVGFNPWLVPHYVQAYLQDTVPHEIAHYFEFHINKEHTTNPHNATWYQIMSVLGATSPSDCHTYNLNHVPTLHSTFVYRCPCKTWRIQTITHKKISRGAEYRCDTCNSLIEYSVPYHILPTSLEGKSKVEQLKVIYDLNFTLNVYEFVELCVSRGFAASYARKVWYKCRPKPKK